MKRAQLDAATAHLEPPFAVVDLDAWDANALDLTRRAAGVPIRVASKSVRVRSLLADALARDGYAGILAFTLPEALWLEDQGMADDIVVAYPTADRTALKQLAAREGSRITVMVDDAEQLDLLGDGPIRVALDVDASLRELGGHVHIGARRSPLHSVDDVVRLARQVVARPGLSLVGLMSYEAQIAGVASDPPSRLRGVAIRAMQARSGAELAERRAAIVAAVRGITDLEFVNGGGTGSLEQTGAEAAVTELAAGSGLLAPVLFDHYTQFTPHPAALFALSVTRRPSPGRVTVLGGGWIASGAAGADRLPTPYLPEGLQLESLEGAGEVQTPLKGRAADALRIGDRVWFRHAKAGELMEHVDEVHLVRGDTVVDTVPTYRGEGHAFL